MTSSPPENGRRRTSRSTGRKRRPRHADSGIWETAPTALGRRLRSPTESWQGKTITEATSKLVLVLGPMVRPDMLDFVPGLTPFRHILRKVRSKTALHLDVICHAC